MFSNIKISRRLMILISALTLIFVTTGAVTLVGMSDMSNDTATLNAKTAESAEFAKIAGSVRFHMIDVSQQLAAGAILPTSMDGDGTQAGFDLEFTRAISDAVTVPVIASGGAGNLQHFYDAVMKGGAQVLLAASVFHYRILSIGQVKEFLREKGLEVVL